jgi:pilus assembly protein Flp/PilA
VIAVLCAPAVLRSTAFPTSLINDDSGQGLAEYGIVLGFVAVLCVAAVVFIGDQLKGNLNSIGSSI